MQSVGRRCHHLAALLLHLCMRRQLIAPDKVQDRRVMRGILELGYTYNPFVRPGYKGPVGGEGGGFVGEGPKKKSCSSTSSY